MKKKIKCIGLLFMLLSSAIYAQKDNAKLAGKEASVTLYLVRHGKTIFNTLERVQGWSDTPLTQAGVQVVGYLAKGLQDTCFTGVYTSDSGRARETAQIIMSGNRHAFGVPVYDVPDFREWNFGSYEGEPSGATLKIYDALTREKAGKSYFELSLPEMGDYNRQADPKGWAENWKEIETRIERALTRIVAETQAKGGGNVLVVSHGFTITSVLYMLNKEKVKLGLKNASVTRIVYHDGKYTVTAMNDMSFADRGKDISN